MPHFIKRGLQILFNEGLLICLYKVKEHIRGNHYYEKWIEKKENTENGERVIFSYNPLISILMPVYNVEKDILIQCIESVRTQTYKNWQLCIADDCSDMAEVKEVLESYENDDRIDICYRTENGHISKATNTALDIANGEYIALLDCDDILSENALYEVVKVLNENPNIDFIYSDEDKIDEAGKHRHTPHFKPDWSRDTLMSYMYTCHLSVYRKSVAVSIGGFRSECDGAQDYDFALRFTEVTDDKNIYHIPKILYHWRVRKGSTSEDASAKPYVIEATHKAKKEALSRRGIDAELEFIEDLCFYRVNYIPDNKDKVSIVILSKDNPDILSRCITSIISKNNYKNYEIIVVDNGSTAANKRLYENLCSENKCIYHYEPMDFNFSKMCNKGASLSSGSYLLFLNDDIEVIQEKWLERMLGQASLSYAGAVGAKLLYPDSDLIQHTGVINIMNGPSHALCGYSDKDMCAFARNIMDFNYLAVTAACLMISKEKFYEIGAFDESMAVSYNDVELCFRLVKKGYFNVVRNDAILYHYESYSRGYDAVSDSKMIRLTKERDRLYDKHPEFAPGNHMDPFYNCNFAQNRVDFSNNYDNIGSFTSKGKSVKLSDYKESDDIIFKIDSMDTDNGVNVAGWAYDSVKGFNNLKKVSVLAIKDCSATVYDTVKIYRPDVGAITHRKRMYMIGFQCASSDSYDKDCRYAVVIGKKIRYIDKK